MISTSRFTRSTREVEAEMVSLGSSVPNRFEVALNLVKARHIDELVEERLNARSLRVQQLVQHRMLQNLEMQHQML